MSTRRADDSRERDFVLDPMRRVERAVHRELEDLMSRTGYSDVRVPHLNVFAHVPRGTGIRMSELAERMQLTKGAVTQLVGYLEAHGYLERVSDPADGRAVLVRPTEAANRGYELGRARLAELEASWEERVGEDRWRTFKTVLEEVARLQEARIGRLVATPNTRRA
jgi:DNA-binding MarR family transcriptional regulator